jgi:hypothetical protein
MKLHCKNYATNLCSLHCVHCTEYATVEIESTVKTKNLAGTVLLRTCAEIFFMYRRPTLCTLHIAADFLKSLEIAVVWGGGGTGIMCIYYIPVDDGMEQVLGRASRI